MVHSTKVKKHFLFSLPLFATMMMLRVTQAFVAPSRSTFVARRSAAVATATASNRLRMASTEASTPAAPAASTQYPFSDVEKKWQEFWAENKTFKTPERNPDKPKKYVLDMFPYPSGAGLHVGHPEGYTGKPHFSSFFRFMRRTWLSC